MKIFLSALENAFFCKTSEPVAKRLVAKYGKMKYNLMSFFSIRTKLPLATFIRDNTEEIMIDSGAHSFQKKAINNWELYTKKYAEFIKKFDRPNVLGFFEMDVDNIIGYEKVLYLRQILESVSNKIIPVWHYNRGIDDYKAMCKKYSGKIVAITGFKNEDIKDKDYFMFLKYAKKFNCKVHCLGMTRKSILDKVPFDFVDSSSWHMQGIYGRIGKKKVSRAFSKISRGIIELENYKIASEMQKYYHTKWRHICKD